MLLVRPLLLATLSLSLVAACKADESSAVRGHGLNIAPLSAIAQAHVYEGAVRAAFEVDDESLSLLLDPRELPRDIGLTIGARLSDSIGAELRRRGVTKGTCEPPLATDRGSPKCTAALPGYVVRFSPIFTLRGDSVQVYLYAQKYDSPTSGNSDRLRFERAYQVVPRGGDAWRAVREGRVPKEIRGEKK